MVIEVVRSAQRSLRGFVSGLSLLVLLAMQVVLSSPANAAPGDLDPTFGVGGTVTTDLGGEDEIIGLALQPDGKIVAVGQVFHDATGASDFAITRYTSTGVLDATFGSGGAVTTDFGTRNDIAGGVAIQSDGKIVVSGLSFVGADRSTEDFALARYGPDGSLDPTFGVGGMVLTDFGGESDSALGGVVILPNGKIVTSGTVNSDASGTIADFGLARYDADGGLDASFGQGGKVVTNIDDHHGYADSMVLQPDGKIVLGGGCADGLALARYQTDGSLDPAFGNGGIVAGIADGAFANDLALQPDGKFVAAGVATALSSPPDFGDFGVERLSADGTLDPTFGIGGTDHHRHRRR